MILSYSVIMCALAHVLPALSPVLYMIFGYPTPEFWFLPFGIQNTYVTTQNYKLYSSPPPPSILILSHFLLSQKTSYRVPHHDTPMGFGVAVIVSLMMCSVSAMICITFSVIFISTCTNIGSFMKDISMIIIESNADIKRKIAILNKLMEFIHLHSQCYR